eukprot:UN07467
MLKHIYYKCLLYSAVCVQRFDVHEALHVTLRFTFCCVLHRCENQDIRC